MDASGQDDLFALDGIVSVAEPLHSSISVEPWSERERLAHEKATLGLYLSGHPIAEYESELAAMITAGLGDIQTEGPRSGVKQETRAVVAGLIVDLRTRQSRSGKRMAFASLDDRTGRLEVAVYPEVFDQSRDVLTKDALVVVEGTLTFDEYSGHNRLTAERIHSIEAARGRFAKQLVIAWRAAGVANRPNECGPLEELRALLKPFQGGACPIVIDYRSDAAATRLRLGEVWRVHPGDDLLQRLKKRLGPESVRVVYQ